MPKVIDLSLEDAISLPEIYIYGESTGQGPAWTFLTDRVRATMANRYGTIEYFMFYSVDNLFNFRTPTTRVQYNFKVEIAMKTETNCINYGGYMFNGITYLYNSGGEAYRICIGTMTCRIGSVNCCAYGGWIYTESTNSWSNINETAYSTSIFSSDAILTIYLNFKYNPTSNKYICTWSVAGNGVMKLEDQSLVNGGLVAAFLEHKWKLGMFLKLLDTNIGDYYRVELLKVVYV